MKLLFSLLFLAVFSGECDQKHSNAVNQEQKIRGIIYEANTRGFYERVWIIKDSVSFSSDRELKDVLVSTCAAKDWDTLVNLVKGINLKELPELEAPTKRHQFDGAAMATLTVELGNESFKTKVFDHGNPPEAISPLVNKVLSMKEMMAKQ